MIEARHLSRRYGDFLAVDGVSFAIGHGEIVGLLGHNGAGKTTIMKMLTGYLEPSEGSVAVDGTIVEDDRQAVQAKLGYLPENLPLYPELSVADYLAWVAELRGIDPAQAVRRAIEATELGGKALDPIATLSRGYKQRLGVAQAILHEPRFLILDEPTNGLDPGQTQHMRTLIRRLSEHATVILSTHIMQEVNALCDRVLILHGGVLAVDERLEDLRASNRLQLRTAVDADPATVLGSVAGVAGVSRAGAGVWDVELSGRPDDAAAGVAAAMVGAGLPVYELASGQRDLEAVFREVSEMDLAARRGAGEAAHAA
ncbi:MAG: multidrug ABC transporter ATP-binding protein [Gammaproteobacteria bacterium]|nr:multidrug ABC transporter ATP-binding protein [Gammaproteobacteria bacterium]